MNNYIYIIAGLPVLDRDASANAELKTDELMEEIHSQLGAGDNATLDFLLDAWNEGSLTADFYGRALAHREKFIRDYFLFDLELRNAKTAYLNKELKRPEGTDCIVLPQLEDSEWDRKAEVAAILDGEDILERERGIDGLYWKYIDEVTVLDNLSFSLILAFVAKMKIVERWLRLDPATGREMFRKLVDEIRKTR